MTFLAAACGILIVVLGLLGAGRTPTDAQSMTEITCLVGGLILCFIAVVLARLAALGKRLDAFEVVPLAPSPDAPTDRASDRRFPAGTDGLE